jgi:hypothetical protein
MLELALGARVETGLGAEALAAAESSVSSETIITRRHWPIACLASDLDSSTLRYGLLDDMKHTRSC